MRRTLFAMTAALSAALAQPASAAITNIFVVPTAWRLENYANNYVVVHTFGTTGGCAALRLPAAWSNDDRNRFWSTVMTGKVANKRVFVYFDDATCLIVSYGLPEGQL